MRLSGSVLRICKTANLYLSFIGMGMCISVIGPTILDLQYLTGTNNTEIGFIFIARSSGFLIGSLIGGIMFDSLNIQQQLLIICSLLMGVFTFLVPWCHTLPLLLSTIAVAAISMGILNTGTNVCCLKIWGKKGAPIFQGLHFSFAVGGFLGPMVAAPFLNSEIENTKTSTTETTSYINSQGNEYDSHSNSSGKSFADEFINNTFALLATTSAAFKIPMIAYSYTIIGLYCLLVCVSISIVWHLSKNEKETTAVDTDAIKDPETSFKVKIVVLTAILTSFICGIEIAYAQMLTVYAVKGEHKLSKATGSYVTSLFWAMFMVSRACSIVLSLKISSAKLVGFDVTATALSCIILMFFAPHYVTWLWIGSAFLGSSLASLFPAAVSWMERYIIVTNKIASFFTVLSSMGEMLVPLIIGIYIETIPDILFIFSVVVSCICLIDFCVLCFLLRHKREKYVGKNEPIQMKVPVHEERKSLPHEEIKI